MSTYYTSSNQDDVYNYSSQPKMSALYEEDGRASYNSRLGSYSQQTAEKPSYNFQQAPQTDSTYYPVNAGNIEPQSSRANAQKFSALLYGDYAPVQEAQQKKSSFPPATQEDVHQPINRNNFTSPYESPNREYVAYPKDSHLNPTNHVLPNASKAPHTYNLAANEESYDYSQNYDYIYDVPEKPFASQESKYKKPANEDSYDYSHNYDYAFDVPAEKTPASQGTKKFSVPVSDIHGFDPHQLMASMSAYQGYNALEPAPQRNTKIFIDDSAEAKKSYRGPSNEPNFPQENKNLIAPPKQTRKGEEKQFEAVETQEFEVNETQVYLEETTQYEFHDDGEENTFDAYYEDLASQPRASETRKSAKPEEHEPEDHGNMERIRKELAQAEEKLEGLINQNMKKLEKDKADPKKVMATPNENNEANKSDDKVNIKKRETLGKDEIWVLNVPDSIRKEDITAKIPKKASRVLTRLNKVNLISYCFDKYDNC